jgi:hypothetical protein
MCHALGGLGIHLLEEEKWMRGAHATELGVPPVKISKGGKAELRSAPGKPKATRVKVPPVE